MESFSFKENILIRSVTCLLFGMAGVVVAVGALSRAFASDGGVVYALPGILALVIGVGLFWFFYLSFRSCQAITVTPEQITASSRARGTQTIFWQNLVNISEMPMGGQKVSGFLPVVTAMMSYYFAMPVMAGDEQRGVFKLEAKDGTTISLREHLLYPHRLEQLRHAASLYAPASSPIQVILKSNIQN